MAHKTLIGGTAYTVKGGRCLVGGTGYKISGGRTLVNGTGYKIGFEYPTFANATWEDVVSAVNDHYAGSVNLADIWSVGNEKTISLAAMQGVLCSPDLEPDPLENHPAQTVRIKIIGIDHDTLETPVNGHTKAALTLQLTNCLSEKGMMSDVNPTTPWYYSMRMAWTNNVFTEALPTTVKNALRSVAKVSSGTTTYEKCFLISMSELIGSYTYGAEGTQYAYYSDVNNRLKTLGDNSQVNTFWFTRTFFNSSLYYYYYGWGEYGSARYLTTSSHSGICPAFCL